MTLEKQIEALRNDVNKLIDLISNPQDPESFDLSISDDPSAKEIKHTSNQIKQIITLLIGTCEDLIVATKSKSREEVLLDVQAKLNDAIKTFDQKWPELQNPFDFKVGDEVEFDTLHPETGKCRVICGIIQRIFGQHAEIDVAGDLEGYVVLMHGLRHSGNGRCGDSFTDSGDN